jgi:hypothetical protein
MTSMTITLNADGTFSDGKNELTLRQVIGEARTRRDAARADAKKAREAKKAAKSAAKRDKVVARAEKLVAELKSLGTDQTVIDDLVAKLGSK